MTRLIGTLKPEDVEDLPKEFGQRLREGYIDFPDETLFLGEKLGNFFADMIETAADEGCFIIEGDFPFSNDEEE